MEEHEHQREDLDTFTNVLRTRYYNSGYREGLFKGKSEVIQDGFDRGYRLGTILAVLKVSETCIAQKETEKKESDAETDKTLEDIENEIVNLRGELEKNVPEIKIATNLFQDI